MKDGHCGGGSARTNRFARPKHLINRQAKEQEAKELDERQFSQRVRACEQKLYNTARMLLPCQADCEDAVQEALFKAWARLDSLRDTGRFEAWLMRILINECKMLLRRRRAHRESALTGAEEDFRVPDAPPGAEEMRAALRALEEKYRLGESKNYTEDKAEDLTNCRATAVREGNAVVLYIEGRIHSYVGKVDLGYSVYTENGEAVSVRFTLKEEGVENVPMEFAAVEFYGLALQKVCVQYTPFAAFLQVAYAPALSGEAVAESGAYDPAGIYYGTEGGHYGHAVPDCQGMANATEWTGQELLDMSRPPCPVCVVPDSTKDKNSFLAQYGWTFDLLAADGQSLLDADSPWTRYNNASLYGQPEEWRTVSLPLRPDASLGGALSLEPYLAEDDIAIEAPRIPCWLAETAPVG